jgi:hypothetical protein
MYNTIWNKIYTIIDWIVTAQTLPLNFVYNYGKKLWDDGYPMATVTPSEGGKMEPMDQIRYNLDCVYDISIYVQNKSIATNEPIIRQIVDWILVALKSDAYLTWSALNSRFELQRGYVWDEQPLRVAIIKCFYTICVQ